MLIWTLNLQLHLDLGSGSLHLSFLDLVLHHVSLLILDSLLAAGSFAESVEVAFAELVKAAFAGVALTEAAFVELERSSWAVICTPAAVSDHSMVFIAELTG